jgi:aminoglycoside N3'-acetyltransferase
MSKVTLEELRRVVRELGIALSPLCLHSSFKSIGGVEGGPRTLIDAFLLEGCTLLVPTFTDHFQIPPPVGMRPARNGWDYGSRPRGTVEGRPVYSADTFEISAEDMGIVPATIVGLPERVRGNHPLNSFTAIGPLAEDLALGQNGLDVYAPLKRLAEGGGWVVLIGVGLTRMTLLHLAEQQAGRNLFRRWARGADGQPVMVAVGGCSEGFGNFEPVLAPLARERRVGRSLWRALPVQELLEAARRAIQEDPAITHCGDAACNRCNDAVLGGPVID